MSIDVTNSPEQERYEISVDGRQAGVVTYRERPGLLALLHTEIDDDFAGQGLGSKLARGVLDDARSRSLEVLPFCPFMSGWIGKHPEYVDLVPAERRAHFDLA